MIELVAPFVPVHGSNVLARGLNFAIAPSVLPKEEFVIAIEKASRGMKPDEGDVFRNEVLSSLRSAKCPKPNLSRQELQALTDFKEIQTL